MAYYLIDFENVKSRGMEGVELLAEEDTVCIFYSDNADSMTFDLHRKLNETKAQIIYHKVAVVPRMHWISSWQRISVT